MVKDFRVKTLFFINTNLTLKQYISAIIIRLISVEIRKVD